MKNICIILFAQLLIMDNAYAYIDPVSGGIIIQFLIAIIAGIATFWFSIKKKIISLFKKKKIDENLKNDDKKNNS